MQTDLWRSLDEATRLTVERLVAEEQVRRTASAPKARKRPAAEDDTPSRRVRPGQAAPSSLSSVFTSLPAPAALKAEHVSQLDAACARAAHAGHEPPGAMFHTLVLHMMYGAGDGPHPSPSAALLCERDACAYATRVLRALRAAVGGDSRSTVRIGDFAQLMPDTLRMYLRWKLLRGMAKSEENEGEGKGAMVTEEDSGRGGGAGGGDEDGAQIQEEDDEEKQQLALLQAQTEEEIRMDGPSSSSSSSSSGPAHPHAEVDVDPSAVDTLAMKAFKDRLHFANERSARLSTAAYTSFVQARECGFVGSARASRSFASILPPPALTRTCLEVLGYMAYERVCSIVEEANKAVHDGKLQAMDPVEYLSEEAKAGARHAGKKGRTTSAPAALPCTAYIAALAAAPALPAELDSRVQSLHAAGARHAASEAWRVARQAEEAQVAVENERVKQGAGTGARDVQGDQAFLAAVQSSSVAAESGCSVSGVPTATTTTPLPRLKSLSRK